MIILRIALALSLSFPQSSSKLPLKGVAGVTSSGSAGIALVQHNEKDQSTSVTSTTITYNSNPTANNLLLVCTRVASTNTDVTITDTIGNTWTKGTFVTRASAASERCSWTINTTSGADTITVTPDSSSAMRIGITEWSGTVTSTPLDQQSTNNGNDSSPNAGNITPAANNYLVVASVGVANTATCTASTNFTLVNEVPAAANSKLCVQYWIQTTATTTNGGMTLSSSQGWVAAVMSFKSL